MKFFYSLLLSLSLLCSANAQNAGLFQTYVIVTVNSTTTYRAGSLNADNNTNTFNNVNLGSATTSIFLNGGQVKTFKNNNNNGGGDVQGGTMFYRVYRQGTTAPSYSSITLAFAENNLGGTTGNQRWETNNAAINIGNNTTPGTYVLDVYFTIAATGASVGTTTDGSPTNPLKATFTATSTSLPVSLASFNAKANGRMANLDWATASETNNAYFEVERSADASSFASLGRVAGRGTTAARHTYSFTDEAPANGANYYRLKQVDTDGTFSYSPVRVVLIRNNGELAILGNPVSTELNVSGLVAGSTAELVDMNGQVRHRQTVTDDQMQVNVRSFASGTYLLRVTEPTGTLTKRILISQ